MMSQSGMQTLSIIVLSGTVPYVKVLLLNYSFSMECGSYHGYAAYQATHDIPRNPKENKLYK